MISRRDVSGSSADDAAVNRSRRRLALRGLCVIAAVAFLWLAVISRMADMSAVWDHISGLGLMECAVLGAIAVASLLAYGFVLTSAMPGLSFSQATVVSQSSTAVANTMPAGGAMGVAVSYRYYTSWGFAPSAISRNVMVTGIWNLFAKLVLPVIAVVAIVSTGGSAGGLVVAASVGVVVLAVTAAGAIVLLSSEAGARKVGAWIGRVVERTRRILRRPGTQDGAAAGVRFRAETIDLLRHCSVRLSAAMLVSHLSVFVVLLWSLRATGVTAAQVGAAEVLASFAIVRLASAVPLTPGGAGLVEAGLAGALIAAGGARASVVAGVLVFRTLTFVLPLPAGLATYVIWRRKARWRKPVSLVSPAV
jgi:uncharacterized membrane protein YbhN (UPF0104 family)